MILGKGSTYYLDTTLAVEKEFPVNFDEHQKSFCLSLHYNGMNSYIYFNNVKIYKLKTKDSEINTVPMFMQCFKRLFS